MGNSKHAQASSAVSTPQPIPRVGGIAGLSALGAIAFATIAVSVGAGVAFVADILAGGEDPAAASALGALGAIGAAVTGGVGVLLLRGAKRGRTQALLDAASPMHPLMRRLMTEAPGTYTHSMAAANLAQAAAEAVGANSLLARVGAYYHDIGKLMRPCYFAENINGTNPHDAETPVFSAGIITAHVQDGVALAQEYRLPDGIVNIIREHHGTSLVRYFYSKATQAQTGVVEADYRYSGSTPRSKEAAIVMLADASEASVRALVQPTQQDVEDVVRGVLDDRVRDGQLAESGLSEGEIDLVADVCVRQLVSYRHVRCPYPALGGGECECR